MKTNQHLPTSARPGSILATAGAVCAGFIASAGGATVSLGTAQDYGVLAADTITNTGGTLITGNVGLTPGTAITALPPGNVTGTINIANSAAVQARTDAGVAYLDMAGRTPTQTLTDQNLGNRTLTPGVYFFASSALLDGPLILDGQGLADPLFIFQIGTALTTGTGSSITGIGGAYSSNVFFQVGSSATLGTGTEFWGTIIASEDITLTTGASMYGRAIALNGAVTLDGNTIDAVTVVPEPASASLALLGATFSCFARRRTALAR